MKGQLGCGLFLCEGKHYLLHKLVGGNGSDMILLTQTLQEGAYLLLNHRTAGVHKKIVGTGEKGQVCVLDVVCLKECIGGGEAHGSGLDTLFGKLQFFHTDIPAGVDPCNDDRRDNGC